MILLRLGHSQSMRGSVAMYQVVSRLSSSSLFLFLPRLIMKDNTVMNDISGLLPSWLNGGLLNRLLSWANRTIYSIHYLINYLFSSWELEPRKLRANRNICSLEAQAKIELLLEKSRNTYSGVESLGNYFAKGSRKIEQFITWETLNYVLSSRNLERREQIELFIHLRLKSKLFITWEISNCVVKVLSGRHCAGEPRPFGQKKTSFKWSFQARKDWHPVTRSSSCYPQLHFQLTCQALNIMRTHQRSQTFLLDLADCSKLRLFSCRIGGLQFVTCAVVW